MYHDKMWDGYSKWGIYSILNTLRMLTLSPRVNGNHFKDDVFECIFLNENLWISIKMSLKFVPKGPFNAIPLLVQIMAWRRPGVQFIFPIIGFMRKDFITVISLCTRDRLRLRCVQWGPHLNSSWVAHNTNICATMRCEAGTINKVFIAPLAYHWG